MGSIALLSTVTVEKNLCIQSQDSIPGLLGEKRERYLCARRAPFFRELHFLLKRAFRGLPRGQKRSRFRRSARFRLDFRRNWQKFRNSEAVLFCWQIKVLLSSISETTNSISGLFGEFSQFIFCRRDRETKKNSRAWKAFFRKLGLFPMDIPAYIDPILWLTNQEGLKKSSDILTWTQSYKNIFGVDLCYTGILVGSRFVDSVLCWF